MELPNHNRGHQRLLMLSLVRYNREDQKEAQAGLAELPEDEVKDNGERHRQPGERLADA